MTKCGPGARTFGCARSDRYGLPLLLVAAFLAACSGDGPRRHEIVIQNFEYVPAALTVSAGDTVVWLNKDMVPHTATAEDRAWDTGSVVAGEAEVVVAGREGAQRYICAFHPNMTATLTVR